MWMEIDMFEYAILKNKYLLKPYDMVLGAVQLTERVKACKRM